MPFIMNRITFRSAYANKSVTYGDQISAYITDAWRFNRRLTFNWGVRYDRQHPWVPEQSNPAMSANDDLSGLFKGGNFAKQDGFALYNNVVPRLGVVWDVDGKGRNVVKGSYSLYTGTVDQRRRVQPERRQDARASTSATSMATATSRLASAK